MDGKVIYRPLQLRGILCQRSRVDHVEIFFAVFNFGTEDDTFLGLRRHGAGAGGWRAGGGVLGDAGGRIDGVGLLIGQIG